MKDNKSTNNLADLDQSKQSNSWNEGYATLFNENNNSPKNDSTENTKYHNELDKPVDTENIPFWKKNKGLLIGLAVLILIATIAVIYSFQGAGTSNSPTPTSIESTSSTSADTNSETQTEPSIPGEPINVSIKTNLVDPSVSGEEVPEGMSEETLSEMISTQTQLLFNGTDSLYIEVIKNESPYTLSVRSMPVFYDEYNDLLSIGFGLGYDGNVSNTYALAPGGTEVFHFSIEGKIASIKPNVTASKSFDDIAASQRLTIEKSSMDDEKLFFSVLCRDMIVEPVVMTVLFYDGGDIVALQKYKGQPMYEGDRAVFSASKPSSKYDSISVFFSESTDF